jgi:hypothetical protein
MGDTIEIWDDEKAEAQRMESEELGAALEEIMGTDKGLLI